MGRKKSGKIILIIIILLIILIIISGIAYTYLATDLFRSNKELFFKYITQMGDMEEGFIEAPIKEYFKKQKSTSYTTDGAISVDITTSNGRQQFENTNNMNLTFNGQVDTANSQLIQNISLNYSNDVKFPLTYKQIGETMGIQTDYVGSKYIAINQNRTQNLENTSTTGDEVAEITSDFEKWKEFTNVPLTQEDMEYFKETYGNLLNQQLQDSFFSKTEENNAKGYKLTIDGENLKRMIVNLLETLKNDQGTLDKMNEYIKTEKDSSKITTTDIDNMIKSIENNSELDHEKLEITVYETKGKTTCFIAKINEVEMQFEKVVTGNDIQYTMQIQLNDENQTGKIGLIAKFAGLQSMQSITENYELSIEAEELKYQYNYNNNIEFTNSTNIELFNNDNSLMLNEMQTEQKNNFIDAVIERIQSVNKEQMEQLGLEENENPLRYVIPPIFSNLTLNNEIGGQISEEEINTFNKKFEMYESSNLMGVTVKGLLSTIQLNNESEDNRKIEEIHFDGQEYEVTDQNITLIKSSIETETAYRVEFEKNEDTGLIYRVVINKK